MSTLRKNNQKERHKNRINGAVVEKKKKIVLILRRFKYYKRYVELDHFYSKIFFFVFFLLHFRMTIFLKKKTASYDYRDGKKSFGLPIAKTRKRPR